MNGRVLRISTVTRFSSEDANVPSRGQPSRRPDNRVFYGAANSQPLKNILVGLDDDSATICLRKESPICFVNQSTVIVIWVCYKNIYAKLCKKMRSICKFCSL